MTEKATARQLDLKKTGSGVLISVRAAPGASRDRIIGVHAKSLKIAVTAPALEGKANKALLRIMSKKLGIKRSSISLHSGRTTRNKCFLLAGIDEEEALKLVADALGDA